MNLKTYNMNLLIQNPFFDGNQHSPVAKAHARLEDDFLWNRWNICDDSANRGDTGTGKVDASTILDQQGMNFIFTSVWESLAQRFDLTNDAVIPKAASPALWRATVGHQRRDATFGIEPLPTLERTATDVEGIHGCCQTMLAPKV